ncbi:MAG: hypothetical protein FWG80_04070 [Alphaproteobacteria bacterium]|nr:hypothetical protein [Alphaproteobacteria bacterium]
MRKLVICSLLFTICAFGAGAEWLPNFEDVPMMEKTFVVEEEGFVYSRPDGKIIQATIKSDKVSRRQFQRFYSDALKELGWRRTRDTRNLQTFVRGDDELNIEITEAEPLSAQFTLTPR